MPAITRAGSPGITRITTNTIVDISRTVRIKRPNLLRAKSKIDQSFLKSAVVYWNNPNPDEKQRSATKALRHKENLTMIKTLVSS
jgi:hypothetical protein